MSFRSGIIKLPSTELALCPVIILLLLYRSRSCSTSFTIIITSFDCSHCLSKHFTLSFPFSSFFPSFNGFILRHDCFLLFRWLFRRRFLLIWCFLFCCFHFSLLFGIKLFPFLNKHLQTYLFMFFNCFFFNINYSLVCFLFKICYEVIYNLWVFCRTLHSILILIFIFSIFIRTKLICSLFINIHFRRFDFVAHFILIKVLRFLFLFLLLCLLYLIIISTALYFRIRRLFTLWEIWLVGLMIFFFKLI